MKPVGVRLSWILVLLLGGTRSALPPGCKSSEQRAKKLPEGGLDRKVVCSNLELRQVLEPEWLPNRTVALPCKSRYPLLLHWTKEPPMVPHGKKLCRWKSLTCGEFNCLWMSRANPAIAGHKFRRGIPC